MFQDPISPLSPVNFFQIVCECYYLQANSANSLEKKTAVTRKRYLLPAMQGLNADDHFADVYLSWCQDGICLYLEAKAPFIKAASAVNLQNSSNIEIMIDTRDVKTAGFNTRFCHHFVFFPESIEGKIAWELTRFRTEDTHDLCNNEELLVSGHSHESFGWSLGAFIPNSCLHGYDPEQFDRLGFSYKVNSGAALSQHFTVSSKEFQIEQQPSLWCTLKLAK